MAREHCDEWLPHTQDHPTRITSQECAGQKLALLGEGPVFPEVMVVEVPILIGRGTRSLISYVSEILSAPEGALLVNVAKGPLNSCPVYPSR